MTIKWEKAADKFLRIYFWIIIIIWVIIIEAVITDKKLLPETWAKDFKLVAGGLYVAATIGLLGYTYKKNIFSPVFWKIFFFVFLSWEIYATVFLSPPISDFSIFQHLTGLILGLPLYFALFLYGFRYKR
ncbi:MAG: hypothetical protein WC836_17105 [Desulfobacula sp.]|jgi:hypothetical protein